MNDNYPQNVKDILTSYEQIKALYYDEQLSDEFKWQQVSIIANSLYRHHSIYIQTLDVKYFDERSCLDNYFVDLTRYIFNKEPDGLE